MATTTELQRESPLFEQLMHISLTQNLQQEPRIVPLMFRIIPGTRSTGTAGQTERLLHFEIADEFDPYFLYILDIAEQDFHNFKRDQSILVEFAVFPSKIISLLNQCIQSTSNLGSIQTREPSPITTSSSLFTGAPSEPTSLVALPPGKSMFLAKLDLGSSVLSIYEKNDFKNIPHISLQMRPGNDAAIKAYLASRLQFALNVSNGRRLDLERITDELLHERTIRERLASDLHELRTHKDVEVQSLKSNFIQEFSQYQVNASETLEETRKRHDAQLTTMKAALEKAQSDASERIAGLEATIADMQSESSQKDFQIRDLKRFLDTSEKDSQRLQRELDVVTDHRRQVEEQRMQFERETVKLQAQNNSLTIQLADKEESMLKTVALQKASEDARRVSEEKIEMYAKCIEAQQEKLRVGHEELTRGNGVISQLQAKLKQAEQKISTKTEVIRKQEAVINELRGKISEQDKTISDLRTQQHDLQQVHTKQSKDLAEAEALIARQKEQMASNQVTIAYLEQENIKFQLGWSSTSAHLQVDNTPGKVTRDQSSYHHEVSPDAALYTTYTPTPVYVNKATLDAHADLDPHELYKQGLQNLGLADTFPNLLSMDFGVGANTAVTGTGTGMTSGRTRSQPTHYDTSLGDLDYYASAEQLLGRDTKRTNNVKGPATVSPSQQSNGTNTASSSGANGPTALAGSRMYPWKSEAWLDSTSNATAISGQKPLKRASQ